MDKESPHIAHRPLPLLNTGTGMRFKGRSGTLGKSNPYRGLLGWSQGPLIKCISVERESPHPVQKPAGVGSDGVGRDTMEEEDALGW